MNVLYLNSTYRGGGAEKVARQLYCGMKKYDDINVYYLAGRGTRDDEVATIYHKGQLRNGMRRCFCFFDNNQRVHDKIAVVRIINEIIKNKIDVLHIHNFHGNYIGIKDIIEIASYCKIVWTLHDMWAFTGHCAYSLDCEKWKYANCNICKYKYLYPKIRFDIAEKRYSIKRKSFTERNITFVVPSLWLMKQAKCSFLRKEDIRLIFNGVSVPENYNEETRFLKREKYGIPLNKIVLLFSVNKSTNPYKGIEILQEALKIVYHKEKFHLLIIGHINTLHLPSEYSSTIVGYIDNEKMMYDLYHLADVLLMPSNAENFSCTILESMACGTPVIGSDVGGISEQITNGTGWIFPRKDVNEFAKLIDNLIYINSFESYRKQCKKRILGNFTEEKMLDNYHRLYLEEINKRR